MRTFCRKSFAIGLLVAFLVVSTGRAVPVSALADPVQSVAPVFDTQIYQLQDYIDHGALGEPQLDIFYTLAGLYAVGQMGAEDYKLTNPYSTQEGVLAWLKDVGIQSYNTLIGLAPDQIRMADGTLIATSEYKRVLSAYVADLFGCAVKASQYDSFSEFTDDVSNSDHFYIPWNSQTQYGLNTMYQLYGGFYEWQFDESPFTSNFQYKTVSISSGLTIQYNNAVNNLPPYHLKANFDNGSIFWRMNGTVSFPYSELYLFVDTANSIVYLCDSTGHRLTYSDGVYNRDYVYVFYDYSDGTSSVSTGSNLGIFCTYDSFTDFTFSSYADLVQQVFNSFNNPSRALCSGDFNGYHVYFDPSDFIHHCYVGDSWANRHEIFNITDLNIDDSEQPFYVSVPEENNYLLDIKGILLDILNNTDLMDVFINNIYTPDGVLVHDTDLIRITLRLLQDYELDNPPLPVNLNTISELTENTYLTVLKEEALRGGSAFADLVAFWHNCDPEIVYVFFGAGIAILIGAFIGKWGHS